MLNTDNPEEIHDFCQVNNGEYIQLFSKLT